MEWSLIVEMTSLASLFSVANWPKEYKQSSETEEKIFLQAYEKMGLINTKKSVELDGCKKGTICTEGRFKAINCEDLTVHSFGKVEMINSQAIDVFCGDIALLVDTKISGILECADNSILIDCVVQSLIVRSVLRQGMTPSLAKGKTIYLDNTIIEGDVTFHATGKIFACEKSRILGSVTNGTIVRSLKGLSKL